MPATVLHALSMTTPDDPAYENKPSDWNNSHSVSLAIEATEISGLFSNANGISFGLDGTNISASYIPGVQQIDAGGGGVAAQVISFGDSNGLNFYITNASVVGSYTVPSVTQFLTTAALSNHSHGNPQLNLTNLSGTTASNSAGFTLSLSAGNYLTTAALSNHSHGNPTLNLTNLSGTTASNSAGFTLSLSAGNYLTTARASNDAVGLNTAQTNVTWTVNSSGISLNAAGYAGTGTSATNASVTLNSNGLAISVAAPGGGAGVTLSGFEPFHLANPISTTYLPAQGSWYFQPFVVPQALDSGRLNILVSYSNSNGGILRASNGANFATNTTGTRSVSYVNVDSFALYSRGAGANSTRLESFWSNTWGLSLAESVSVILTNATNVRATVAATMTYIASVGSNGSYTTATLASSTSTSTGATVQSTSAYSVGISSLLNRLSGQVLQAMGFNTSIAAGEYWLGQAWSASSTTGGTSIQDIWPLVNQVGIYGISSMPFRPFGATASNTSSQIWPGQGVYSAVSAVPPGTVEFTQIRSIASHITQYFNHINLSAGTA